MIKIHPSSLSDIMTEVKGKGHEALSVGAMTYCYNQAKQFVYGYKPEVKSKYLDKGNMCENDSIALYNLVNFTSVKKNTERRENDYLTGECDIVHEHMLTDIKTSWSLSTFPAITSRIDPKDLKKYVWQGCAYMILWDKPQFEIAYCLVSTPEELINQTEASLHYVDDIDPSLRLTTAYFERTEEKDKLIKIKCEAAQIQIEKYIEEITKEHSE